MIALDGARVLVTGARGFLGGGVAARLVGRAELHLVVRGEAGLPAGGSDRLAHELADRSDVTVHCADLAAPGEADRLVADVRPDVVLHLAGRSSAAHRLDTVHATLRDNLTATVDVLTACAEVGVARVVVPGSLDEPEDGATPTTAYGLARGAVAQAVSMFHDVHGLSVASARVFMAYGPGMAPHKLVAVVAESLRRGEAPVLRSAARSLDWIHLDDAVDGILAVAAADHVRGTSVDLGSGRLTSVGHVAELLCEVSGTGLTPIDRPEAVAAPASAGRVADLDRTARLVGWAPRIDLVDGLARTWAAFVDPCAAAPTAGART